jgi:hypothetical protein
MDLDRCLVISYFGTTPCVRDQLAAVPRPYAGEALMSIRAHGPTARLATSRLQQWIIPQVIVGIQTRPLALF